jgi:hypothetical protein
MIDGRPPILGAIPVAVGCCVSGSSLIAEETGLCLRPMNWSDNALQRLHGLLGGYKGLTHQLVEQLLDDFAAEAGVPLRTHHEYTLAAGRSEKSGAAGVVVCVRAVVGL